MFGKDPELILGISAAGAWRGGDPAFAAACDAVSAASPLCGASRVIRLTPQRVAPFLGKPSKPGTTVIAAAAIGMSSPVATPHPPERSGVEAPVVVAHAGPLPGQRTE
ncbi:MULTISPECIES: hypothetical protein [Streptomyces]|uniref:Uncharacterized protein n=1 Tax=Streptomyces albidocamelliae TaxID=2981135 RepID=A0ABY6EG84_9ACTN|nr:MULTISPECIES: hypothetical protein [unclassified Streptomyces]UXY33302.1 hypothetical protein N8I86_00210 [Streptomyces sp. HUAS 14-6]